MGLKVVAQPFNPALERKFKVGVLWVVELEASQDQRVRPSEKKKERNKGEGGWRDGSYIKNTDSSSRGPEFHSLDHMETRNLCNSSPRVPDSLFWLLKVPGTQVVHIHTHKHLYI